MCNKQIETIEWVYPDFSIKNWYANDIGQNNKVLIVNKSLVFRFPKYEQGITQLKKETRILEYIKDIITIPIPNPIYQSLGKSEPGDVFTGYKLIAGTPLWKEDLQSIKGTELKNGLASQLVTFLVELHSIQKEKTGTLLEAKDRNPRKVMFDLLDKIQNKLFPFIRRDARDE